MEPKQLLRQYLNVSIICTIVTYGIIGLLYWSGAFQWTDSLIYDLNVKWRGRQATSGNVVLVLMDESSAYELNRQRGLWPRPKLDDALQNLCAAGSEVIGLDIILAVPDPNPDIDSSLAKTMWDCNSVVLARITASGSAGEVVPLPAFQEAMIGDGFIDVNPDNDGVLRRVSLLNAKRLEDGNLALLPSFPLEVVRSFLNLDFEFDLSKKDYLTIGASGGKQLLLPNPDLLINYTGGYQGFKNLSYADVVFNRFDPELVKGKIVLIGSSLMLEKDFYNTPFTRFKKSKSPYAEKFAQAQKVDLEKDLGVSCHAYAIETILSQKFIKRPDKKNIIIFTSLAACLGLFFFVPYITPLGAAFTLLLSLAVMFTGAYHLFAFKQIWFDISPIIILLPLQFIGGIAVQRYFEKMKSEQVTELFGRYVSEEVVNELIAGDMDLALTGHKEEVTIFFSDIRGFTSISENLGAEDTGKLLNTYFDAMIPIILESNGTLDKLIGDAIMAFYGAPVKFDDHPDKAARSSLLMLDALTDLKKLNINGVEELDIGIGLNTGDVTIGNLGCEKFMDYTVVGDAVNLASRLEGANKVYGTKIIVSEYTAINLSDDFLLRQLDTVKVKGKDRAVTIFELVGIVSEVGEEKKKAISCFEKGIDHFKKMDWDSAEKMMKMVLEYCRDDGPSLLYIERIKKMRLNPPPKDWDGAIRFDKK